MRYVNYTGEMMHNSIGTSNTTFIPKANNIQVAKVILVSTLENQNETCC